MIIFKTIVAAFKRKNKVLAHFNSTFQTSDQLLRHVKNDLSFICTILIYRQTVSDFTVNVITKLLIHYKINIIKLQINYKIVPFHKSS